MSSVKVEKLINAYVTSNQAVSSLLQLQNKYLLINDTRMTKWINLTIKTMRNKKAGREGRIIGSFLRNRTEKLYAGN